jgi:hypothetical protein
VPVPLGPPISDPIKQYWSSLKSDPAKAVLFGSLTVAATILAGFMLLTFVGGEETDAYKDGYSEGYGSGATQNAIAISKEDACDTDGLHFGDRLATPAEADDYGDGCRDGYGDGIE